MTTIHPDWDETKALAHLAALTAEADRAQVIAEAFEEAADDHRRDEYRIRGQIAHCEARFASPRPGATSA